MCNTRENTQLIDIDCYGINSAAKRDWNTKKKNVICQLYGAAGQGPSSRMLIEGPANVYFTGALLIRQSNVYNAELKMISRGQIALHI